MSHAFYIYGAYGAAALILLAVIGWIVLDGRARQRELRALEAAGVRRRSAGDEKAPR